MDFFNQNRTSLIEGYLTDFPRHIDPDAVRDRFAQIGYDRTNVQKFQGICKMLTREIFIESLIRNKGRVEKVIFAAGLPASGKTSHLKQMAGNEIVYDGTINEEQKFIEFVQAALNSGYAVEIFVYSVDPKRAFESNLNRGDEMNRYVPVSQYEKVAKSINKRRGLLKKHFNNKVKFRNFEHTKFEGKPQDFSPIKVNRNELESIAKKHEFSDSKTLQEILK